MKSSKRDILAELPYKLKMMACIIFSELLMLLLIWYWPAGEREVIFQDIVADDGIVAIDEMVITTQESSPPPPPSPIIPQPVPNDEIIEDEPVMFQDFDLSDFTSLEAIEGVNAPGDSDRVASNPSRPPSVVRIVEPTVPTAARDANLKAEIWVNFLVDEEGNVEEVIVSQIRLYDRDGENYKVVQSIDFNLTSATLQAAMRWRFRPAVNDGRPVRAYTEHIFTFGF